LFILFLGACRVTLSLATQLPAILFLAACLSFCLFPLLVILSLSTCLAFFLSPVACHSVSVHLSVILSLPAFLSFCLCPPVLSFYLSPSSVSFLLSFLCRFNLSLSVFLSVSVFCLSVLIYRLSDIWFGFQIRRSRGGASVGLLRGGQPSTWHALRPASQNLEQGKS
jgi:hypothetical protein